MTLFESTAEYYARYRLPYPDELLDRLAGRRLLDLGCGTGRVFLRVQDRFEEIVALDVDADMLAVAQRTAAPQVRLLRMRGEEIGPELGRFPLVVSGDAFHWMDRALVARKVRDLLEPGGRFVVMGTADTWKSDAPWQQVVRDVYARHLGETRRAGKAGVRIEDPRRHEDYLREAGFDVEETLIDVEHTGAVDEIIGALYSTSFASKAVLGASAQAFETELRRELLALDPRGVHTDTYRFYAISGTIRTR